MSANMYIAKAQNAANLEYKYLETHAYVAIE